MIDIDILERTTDRAVVQYVGEVDPFLEHNATLRSMPQKSDWGRHTASIPNIITTKWLNEEWERGNPIKLFGSEWMEFVARKLQDPEWAYLRVDGPSHRVGYGD